MAVCSLRYQGNCQLGSGWQDRLERVALRLIAIGRPALVDKCRMSWERAELRKRATHLADRLVARVCVRRQQW